MKFSEKVGNGLMNKRLNFVSDPDPYRDTDKTCLGGGMHCSSASALCLKKFPPLTVYNFVKS